MKRTGVEKENKGVKGNLCLLRNVFVGGQAESKVFSVLVCFSERKGKNGSPGECCVLDGSLVIFVFQRACERESQGTEARVRGSLLLPFL